MHGISADATIELSLPRRDKRASVRRRCHEGMRSNTPSISRAEKRLRRAAIGRRSVSFLPMTVELHRRGHNAAFSPSLEAVDIRLVFLCDGRRRRARR